MKDTQIKILAIDDKKDNLISLKAIVEELWPQAHYFYAYNGPDGIELAIEKQPDVILLDIVMPEMDGFEVCRILKVDERTSDIPVVFLTANRKEKDSRIKALEKGAEGFLSKPIDEPELRAQINAMANLKRLRDDKQNQKERLEQLVNERTKELKAQNEALKKLRKEAQVAYQRWEKTFNTMNSGLAVLDVDYNILQSNARFKEDFRANLQSDKLMKCYEMFENDKICQDLCPFELTKKTKRQEYVERKINDKYLKITIDPIFDDNEDLVGAVHITEDITERKEFEEALIKAKEKAEESDRLKTAFLANMSHEIRTPMNGVMGFLDILQDGDVSEEERKEYFSVIDRSGKRLLNTINDILEISKIESGQVVMNESEMDIAKMIHYFKDIYEAQAKNKNITLKINISDSVPSKILTDSNKLESVLTNLIKNALKFTEKGTVELGAKSEDKNLLFYIKDTGCGIPANKTEVIFNRFVQAHYDIDRPQEGSGLGLSISQGYAQMLGGKIWLKSTEGQGSTFYVSIPCKPVDATRKEKELEQGKLSGDNRLLLIVEDDEASYQYLQICLTQKNFQVIRARNGQEGIDLVKQMDNISLVLMDLRMPGVDGFEAAKKIKTLKPELPIIAQSAYSMVEDITRALESGCDAHIGKPIKKRELEQILEKHLQ